MEPSRRLFFISLGAADFVTYDQREILFPILFCQANGSNKFIQLLPFCTGVTTGDPSLVHKLPRVSILFLYEKFNIAI